MIQIGDTIISLDIFEKKFCCDLAVCKGICCVGGGSGAPLEEGEAEQIRENYGKIKPHMKPEGLLPWRNRAFPWSTSRVTWLRRWNRGERVCVYYRRTTGVRGVPLKKRGARGRVLSEKLISCHMYPIRDKQYQNYEGRWIITSGRFADAPLKGWASRNSGVRVFERCSHSQIRGEMVRAVMLRCTGDWDREKSSSDAMIFLDFSLRKKSILSLQRKSKMVDVAQSVRASDCGSEGRRFETDLPPAGTENWISILRFFYFFSVGGEWEFGWKSSGLL